MNRPIKESVKSHIENIELTSEQMSRLMQLQPPVASETKTEKTTKPNSHQPYWWISGAVAAILMIMLTHRIYFPPQSQNIAQLIADEVATNHIKMKPLEVNSDTLDGIRAYFTQLDFSPSPTAYASQWDLDIIGARYCSIQGITAAQIRYTDSQGKLVTIYQTLYQPIVFEQLPPSTFDDPLTLVAKGVKVQIWQENDLLMASVRPAN